MTAHFSFGLPWRTTLCLAFFVVLLMAGCSVGPKYQRPSVPPPPEAYKESQGWKTAQPSDGKLGGDWWTLFGDPELTALEQQIDLSNENLKAAAARFAQARALIRVNQSQKYPTVVAGPSITASRNSANTALSTAKTSTNYGNFTLPFDVSYEVDAWGRVRHSIEAARTEAQATAADLESL